MTAPEPSPVNSVPPLLTIPRVAEHLQVSPKSIRRWIKTGDLVVHRIGRQLRISPNDLETFIKLRCLP